MNVPRGAIAMTAIMCVAEAFSMSGFAAYTTLLPQFQREWGLSNSQAGLISGIVFAGYMTAVPLLTALTDRIDSRRIYLAACLLSAFGALCFTLFAQGLWTALLFQFLIGAGLGGTYMPGLKTLTDQLEGAAQARATAFYSACFGIGSSVSIFVCGYLGRAWDWHTTFLFATAGPVVAALMVNLLMPQGRIRAAHATSPALLDFRPVLANRSTRYYILGYAVHSYELFGQRSWMVAFLVFSATLQPADAMMVISAATLAAIINLCGPLMSVTGNELSLCYGRSRIIFMFMTASGLLACGLGYTAGLPWWAVFTFMCVHCALMLGDAAALTAGAIGSAHPDQRGAMMAVYSFTGFSAALIAPLVFGVVLDVAGGNRSTPAWGLAFASIGIFGAMAPVARWWHTRAQRY